MHRPRCRSGEKEAEAARVKVQNVLDAVYRSITDHAIYMVDPAGIVQAWSLGAESVKGWREEEDKGKDFAMLHSAEEIAAERQRRDLEHALTQGSHRREGWRKRHDGESIWAEVTTSPVHEDHAHLLSVIVQ